jgi:hypothetical protein
MNDVETSKREGDYRSASAAYGAALGGVTSLLLFCLPFPYGLLILCLGLGVQMAGFAVVVWRPMRLPLTTAAALCTAVGCAVQIYVVLHTTAAGNARPQSYADVIYFWPMFAAAAIAPLSVLAEWRWHRDQCNAWKTAMEHCTITDMLLFRHIPDLRGRARTGS